MRVFRIFFLCPLCRSGNVCRRFAAWVFPDSLFARVMDMCSVFLRRLHQLLFWFGAGFLVCAVVCFLWCWCGCLQFAFCLIWKMGFQCAFVLIWKEHRVASLSGLLMTRARSRPTQTRLRRQSFGLAPGLSRRGSVSD